MAKVSPPVLPRDGSLPPPLWLCCGISEAQRLTYHKGSPAPLWLWCGTEQVAKAIVAWHHQQHGVDSQNCLLFTSVFKNTSSGSLHCSRLQSKPARLAKHCKPLARGVWSKLDGRDLVSIVSVWSCNAWDHTVTGAERGTMSAWDHTVTGRPCQPKTWYMYVYIYIYIFTRIFVRASNALDYHTLPNDLNTGNIV